jgi:hypothetical protein
MPANVRPAAPAAEAAAPKEIIKEGLSEVLHLHHRGDRDGEQRLEQANAFRGADCPVQDRIPLSPPGIRRAARPDVLLKNDKDSKLGTTPLPDGIVRVFRDNGRDGLSYLTQQAVKYIPIGDKIELNLGVDPEVIFELIKLRVFRSDLILQINGTNEFRKPGGDGAFKEENATLVGWTDHEVFSQRIRNYTGKAINIEVRHTLPGHILFKSRLEPKLHDFQTVEFKSTVAAGRKPICCSRSVACKERAPSRIM